TGDAIGEVRSARRLFRLADAAQYRAKAVRARGPVVAGREAEAETGADAVLKLADTPPPEGGERRRLRGRRGGSGGAGAPG
ncbi:diguanylate cyclase, partial [Streptomyces albidoflavus]